jgi:hypothetical protein
MEKINTSIASPKYKQMKHDGSGNRTNNKDAGKNNNPEGNNQQSNLVALDVELPNINRIVDNAGLEEKLVSPSSLSE